METAFSDAKLLFYTELRTDELVQSLGVERTIRDLVETMIVYMDHANQAHYSFHRQRKKNIEGDLDGLGSSIEKIDNPELKDSFEKLSKDYEALFARTAKPMVLDFSDVQSIAYAVGTYQDDRNWFQRTFTTENPLDAQVKECAQYYDRFRETGILQGKYFDEDIVPHLRVVVDSDRQMDLRVESLHEMGRKCCDYVNRQGTLLRLADNRDSIHDLYATESWNKLKRGFKDHDWSWLTANWGEDRLLSKRETKEIARYFQRQAEVDGILFKTLNAACIKLMGHPNPEEVVEKLHRGFMDDYKREGYVHVSYTPPAMIENI